MDPSAEPQRAGCLCQWLPHCEILRLDEVVQEHGLLRAAADCNFVVDQVVPNPVFLRHAHVWLANQHAQSRQG